MTDRKQWYVPWWVVIGGLTLPLLAFNSPWFRLGLPELFEVKRWVYGLDREMNFAVWFSAVLFFLSAGVFYDAAYRVAGGLRRAYLELCLIMMALGIDEIATLHERLSSYGGWRILAPFALVLLLMLGDSLRILFRERHTRPVGWLVIAGFGLFFSVVGQEYIEHNVASRSWSEWWGRFFEEASELFGVGLVLVAAARARQGDWRGPLSVVVPDPAAMPRLLPILLGGAVVHLAVAQSLYVVRITPSRAWGNPAVLYPMIVFLLLACWAVWAPHHLARGGRYEAEVRGFWSAVGLFFLISSITTIQNVWGFVGKVVPGLGKRWFYEPHPVLVVVSGFLLFVGLALWRRQRWRALWLLGLPVVAWLDLRLVHPAAEQLANGLLALLCALALLPLGSAREPSERAAGLDAAG